MRKNSDKYLQFPVWLLKGAFLDTQTTFKDIMIAGAFWYMMKNNICFKEALKYYDLEIDSDTFATRGCEIFNNTPENTPLPNIKLSHAEEFATIEKTEHEVATLLIYVAVKSILGLSAVKKITRDLIIARMFGYKSVKDLPESLPEPLRIYFEKYSTEYHFNKVFKELERHWKLCRLNNKHLRARGILIADLSKISISEAMNHSLSTSKRSRDLALKAEKEDAFMQAISKLELKAENKRLVPGKTFNN